MLFLVPVEKSILPPTSDDRVVPDDFDSIGQQGSSSNLVVLNSSDSELKPTTTGMSSERKQILVADSIESIFADRWC